jgi:hypothetical protein
MIVVKMTALEKFPCRGRFLHAGRYRREPSFSSLHQNPHGLCQIWQLTHGLDSPAYTTGRSLPQNKETGR